MGKLRTVQSKLGAIPKQTIASCNSNSWRKPGASSSDRLYTYQWEQYRLRFLQLHPLCCYCEKVGKVTEARVVDHIIPHQGNKDLFWDTNNHQPLCKLCHDSTKAKEEAAAGYRSSTWKTKANG